MIKHIKDVTAITQIRMLWFLGNSRSMLMEKGLWTFPLSWRLCPSEFEIRHNLNKSLHFGVNYLLLTFRQDDEEKSEENICNAFKVFDDEGTGMISTETARHVLIIWLTFVWRMREKVSVNRWYCHKVFSCLGEKLSQEEIDEMVSEFIYRVLF